jgi:putative flippase GtrA
MMQDPETLTDRKSAQKISQRFVDPTVWRFATVGVISTLLDFGLFTMLSFAGASVVVANIAAYLISLVVNFSLNQTWTFSDRSGEAPITSYAIRFFAVHAVSLTLSTALVAGLSQVVFAPLAKAISIPIVVIWTYLALRFWVYVSKSKS